MRWNFKNWLESAEFYDKNYRHEFDRLGKLNPKPFAHWFPEGQNRIYLPFQIDGDHPNFSFLIEVREQLQQYLQIHNFNLVDFRKGLVSPTNMPKRQQRIIPVLQSISKQNSIGIVQLIDKYQKLPMRLNPGINQFSIVISQDPHDIALMTYDRPWKMNSCMRLADDKVEGGAKAYQVIDEVREGGLIAYLIDPEDKDIKKPYSRVLLRRFAGPADIVICEETMYGLDIPNFLQTVKEWAKSKNVKAFGSFRRKGAKWTDTLDDVHFNFPKPKDIIKENQPALKKMLESFSSYEFFDAVPVIIAGYKKLDVNFVSDIFDMINNYFENSYINVKQNEYAFNIPKVALDLDFPVKKVKYIKSAFYIDAVIRFLDSAPNDVAEDLANYLMPILINMTNVVVNPLEVAKHINKNTAFHNYDFIASIPEHILDEMEYEFTNHDLLTIVANNKRDRNAWVDAKQNRDPADVL